MKKLFSTSFQSMGNVQKAFSLICFIEGSGERSCIKHSFKILLLLLSFSMFSGTVISQTTRYWSGNSSASDNIDQGTNWHDGVNPASGDNLTFNNTLNRHFAYSNYGSGSWFNFIITYSGAGGIKLYGDNTYAKKFENNSDGNLFELGPSSASAGNREIGNRVNNDLEINPTGTGGILVSCDKISMDNVNGARNLKVYGSHTLTINGNIYEKNGSGATLQILQGATVILNGNSSYTGATTISSGTLRLGIAEAISNSSNMVLNGGTFSTGASTGYTETIGTLTLSSSSTISFGTGSHTLTYAASNGVSWSGTLSVNNWTSTGPKLYFGTSNMGLTATQLSNINFTGFGTGAKILSTGEIIPASVYISASSGNWNTGSTWVGSSVPSAGAIVFVENGHNVTLDVAASVTGLTIHSGGTFTASDATPRTLTITKSTTGNVTTISNSGTWQNGSGTSTVLVTGAPSGGDAVHSISGTITFQNIVVNKTGGTSNIGCSFGSGSSVAGTLEIGAGGFISTAPPASFYGSNAILKFNQGTGATYNVEAGDYSWSTTQVPNYITISSGTVNLNANRTASGNLLIDGGALILNLNTPNLTIQGNWTRTSGNFTAGSGTVTLSGTTNGVVDVAGGATMNNLVINKTSGTGVNLSCDAIVTGTLTITSGFLSIGVHDLTITGPLTNSAGSGGLVVESGGSLITNGTVSGGATVKREIASDSKWHFISSPVSGQNICDGNFAPLAANFNATTGATFDFYKWSEPTITGGLNWINLKQADWSVNTTAFGATLQFAVGAGYLVDYTGSFGGSTTKSFAGTLISGDQSVTLTTGGNTWNLIGNPFASAINWDNVIKTGILADGYYYVYNEAKSGGAGYESYLNSTYKTSGANGKISAMQGFFVKAASSPLSLPNAARTHDNNWMKKSETSTVNQLTLKMGNDAAWDEAFLVFEAAGSLNKGWYDAEKMFSMSAEVPQVYTLKDNDLKISIGSFPVITGTVTVPVGMVIPSDGSYSFQLSGFESFASLPGIVLEDLKLHTTQNLVQTPAYNFTAATADDPNRFLLHFAGTNGINDALAGGSFHVFASGNTLFVTDNGGQNQGTVYVYNLMGQMISTSAMNGKSVCSMSLDVPAGYYLVKVITAGQNYSTKVFINK